MGPHPSESDWSDAYGKGVFEALRV